MSTVQLRDLELLKDIPGYRAILKAVLKSQIQMLVQQLSDETGEESLILTASIFDGTLCHMGSNNGRDFLEGRDEWKSEFLKHCLTKLPCKKVDTAVESAPSTHVDSRPRVQSATPTPPHVDTGRRSGQDRHVSIDRNVFTDTPHNVESLRVQRSTVTGNIDDVQSRKKRKISHDVQQRKTDTDINETTAVDSSPIIKVERDENNDYEITMNTEHDTGGDMGAGAEGDQMVDDDWCPDTSEFGDAGNQAEMHGPGTSEKPHTSGSDIKLEHFATTVTDDDKCTNKLKESKRNKDAMKNTEWSVNIFESWRVSRQEDNIPELLVMDKATISYWLSRFIVEVRNQNGTEYAGKTLYNILFGLQRHIRNGGRHDINFLQESDPAFFEFNKALDRQFKDLLERDIGTRTCKRHPNTISEKNEEELWEKGVFGLNDAQSLQYTVFFYTCKFFGLRSREAHRSLHCGQFEVGTDMNGRYVQFTGRTCDTGEGVATVQGIKRYCTEGPRCLATYFRVYLAALGNTGYFYRLVLSTHPGSDFLNYSNQPVGVRTLQKFMSEIAKLGDIDDYSLITVANVRFSH